MPRFSFSPADLAPGDTSSAALDTAEITIDSVHSLDDPLFALAYARMWEQFGAAHEVESRDVLGRRLAWDASRPRDGFAMGYDLLLVRHGGKFAAVRDHAAIADAHGVVVHLSHVFVDPAWRRTGLAGWMRALPLQTARRCLALAGLPDTTPITLVAEMEYPDGQDEARTIRLRAYEKAGFRKVDPSVIDYWQPDFRPPGEIDASGGPRPLRFQLVIRRVGHERENTITGAEARVLAQRLYRMYAQDFRPQDMQPVWSHLDTFPSGGTSIALLPPSA